MIKLFHFANDCCLVHVTGLLFILVQYYDAKEVWLVLLEALNRFLLVGNWYPEVSYKWQRLTENGARFIGIQTHSSTLYYLSPRIWRFRHRITGYEIFNIMLIHTNSLMIWLLVPCCVVEYVPDSKDYHLP